MVMMMAKLPAYVCLALYISVMIPASLQKNKGKEVKFRLRSREIPTLKQKIEVPTFKLPAYEPKSILPCTRKLTRVKLAPRESATFQSPNYPEAYPKSSKCKWQFKSKEDITISCGNFQLQLPNRKGKCLDKLKIGSDKYCGTSSPFYEGGTKVKVQFTSNKKNNFNGFSCTAMANSKVPAPEPEPEPEPDPNACKCGQANRNIRIVGGVETLVNEYPWQAALVISGTSQVFSGASVIGSNHILTAAHTIQGVIDNDISYQVLVGAHGLTNAASSQLILNADRFIQHPGFDSTLLDNDIAIIVLRDSIDFTSSEVRPVCLPNSDADAYDSVTATVSGWGTTSFGGSQPDVLMEVDVPTMSNSKCQISYGNFITDNMICAGFDAGGKDGCQGDSGGPLTYYSGSGYIQIGIVSWGNGCADAGFPGVYTRVSNYLSWISSNTASSTTCPAA